MNPNQKSLWTEIDDFSLDEPGVALPFSRRLARENRWSDAHARRAIREYKRFMFLGCVAGHPVSPSEDVDQVWHLHLVYTKSYWKDFCAEILKKPFHHNPTKGGADESAKFEDWYAKTLESYRKFFGEEPPCDIWPTRPVHRELKWIDTASNWVIRKPRLQTLLPIGGALLVLFTVGWGEGEIDLLNVFDMRGPEFLRFYAVFATVVLIGAAILRGRLIRKIRVPQTDPEEELDAYDIAYLSGQGVLAVNAAVLGLVDRKLASVDSEGNVTLLHELGPEAPLHPLERAVVDGCSTFATHLKEIRPRAKEVLGSIRDKLEERGLVFNRYAASGARMYPMLLAAIVPAFGLIKIIIGVNRNKPVGFLIFVSTIIFIGSLVYFLRRPFRTPAADELLSDLRLENDVLRCPSIAQGFAMPTVFPLAIALFGMEALAATPYDDLRKVLVPKTATGGDVGGCGSGCGGGCGGCGGD